MWAIAIPRIPVYCSLESGDAFSVYLTDIHDGNNADERVTVLENSTIPYDGELINLHQGYNKTTGINIHHTRPPKDADPLLLNMI